MKQGADEKMSKKYFNKKGSAIVFLTSLLISMIAAGMVFVHGARSVAAAGYGDAVLTLAGRSILAEFDRRLKDEYGIFAFYGFENQAEAALRFYAESSFEKKLPGEFWKTDGSVLNLYQMKLEYVKVNLASHAMIDVDVFETQIKAHMDYLMVEKGIDYIKDQWKKEQNQDQPQISGDGGDRQERILQNQGEISSLPSKGAAPNGIDIARIIEKGFPSLDEIFNEGATLFRVNEYVLSHFKYRIGGDKQKNTFFENEVEYILYGKFDDAANRKAFRRDFVILRTALNVAHIYADEDKRNAALALAEIMTPGPAAIATQFILIGIWGAAEAENDARLLVAGYPVVLFKTDATWATDLQAVVENGLGSGYIRTKSDSGYVYGDYLRFFLYFARRESKLLRTMDLIQLNLRGSYYKDFLLKNHYAGFSMEAQVSGKKYVYEHQY